MTELRARRGFTLLEVMIGLAILGFALTVLIRSASVSMGGARHAQLVGVATDLARGKMNDIEELLQKDGFTETDQSEGECGEPSKKLGAGATGDVALRDLRDVESELRERLSRSKKFDDEGWPKIGYGYKIEQVELPSWDDLQTMAQNRGSGSAAGSGSGSGEGGFQNSALGGMLSQLGGGFTGAGGASDIDSKQGASFIQSQYSMFQQILKVSIRKITLCIYYDVTNTPYELKVVQYVTDAAAMDKVLSGLGSQDIDDTKTTDPKATKTDPTKAPTKTNPTATGSGKR